MSEIFSCSVKYIDELKVLDNGDIACKPIDVVEVQIKLLPHERRGTFGETKI
ncbi:hypothetical protein ACIQ4I_01425 [Rummeliibacillus sp. NPDC094406]|uniref:hypothetical protein n=1 Tax=Rummeliibacillus sp. NPDC094406 TaxID=3364511 RepID=UPI00380E409F